MIRVHVFVPDPVSTLWDGEVTCSSCTLRRSNRVHDVPKRSAEEDRIDARRLGENEESE